MFFFNNKLEFGAFGNGKNLANKNILVLKKHWWTQSLKRGYPSDNEEETEQKETEDEGKEKNDEMFKKKRA